MKTITKKIASMLLSQKIIKPSSSSSCSSFRPHNLSLIDYTMLPSYIPIASFYPKPPNHNIGQVSQILENSLSKVLSSYYPFAGRITDNKYVDCNNEHIGVEYLNVRINCPMSEVLNHTYNDAIDVVFPQDLPWNSSVNRRLLVVQLSHFDCGGIAVSICISHKIVDAYSVSKFLNDWAITARGHHELDFKPSPLFNAASFFPLTGDHQIPPLVLPEPPPRVSRTYHFSSSSLNQLKNIVAMNSQVHNPTRLEVATALVHKCAMESTNSGLFRSPSLLSHTMNLRPLLPLNTIGNASTFFSLLSKTEDEIQVPRFVAQLRKSKQECRDKWNDNNTSPLDRLVSALFEQDKVCAEIFEKNTYDTYVCSSLCNLRFYDTDFGWGRPIRVTLARSPVKSAFVFIDDPNGDGINALITFEEDDMLRFQSNKELLEFASPVARLPE